MVILSTKLLRPLTQKIVDSLPHAPICAECGARADQQAVGRQAGWFYDHQGAEEVGPSTFYCPSHALLEDLDPDWPGNQELLFRAPVSRKMPLQIDSLDELFLDLKFYSTLRAAQQGRGKGWWVSLPVGYGFATYQYVTPSVKLRPVIDQMIYGDEGDYYVEITFRNDGLALVCLKYERILGYRLVCLVKQEEVLDFFARHITNC